jgi:GTP-binding protein EngB required for normal cell division
MPVKQITIDLNGERQIKMKLDTESLLKEIRTVLLDCITYPFKFVYIDEDDQEQEFPKENEIKKKLSDILDSRYLHIKKEKIIRKILGKKLDKKGDLEFFLFPKVQFTSLQLECASNIMVAGETGVGKSTWIHAFLNYMQGIQIEENIRYLLFNEKEKQEKYAKKYEKEYGKKLEGSSVTDIPEVYNIEPTVLFDNPIRLIDTAGFGDTRGKEFDEKITKDIQKLFENSNIQSLNAVCFIFKASETRFHDRMKYILDKLFSLFGEDIKKNIILIFTFADSFNDFPALNALKNENSIFTKILGNIENLSYFAFNNKVYFSDDRETFINKFEKNKQNFEKFFCFINNLKPIPIDETKKVMNLRVKIIDNINSFFQRIDQIIELIEKLKYYKYYYRYKYRYIEKDIDNNLKYALKCLNESKLYNNQLNLIALKKDDKRYDFIKQILSDKIENSHQDKNIYLLFVNELDNINFGSSVYKFKNILLKMKYKKK